MNVFEVVTGRATNPAALTALTANTGDTFTVRAFGAGAVPVLENMWTEQATAGLVRARSPRMHDFTQGIRLEGYAATVKALLPLGSEQRLYQTDTVTYEIQGGGAEVDAAGFLLYYRDVDAGGAKLAMWESVKPLILNYLTVQVTITDPTVSGNWGAGNLLNSFSDLMKAETNYAVLGYTASARCTAVALQGPDTGNYRLGGPGGTDPLETREWFKNLSMAHGQPHIPIINSQNVGATNAFTSRVTTGGTVDVQFIMAQLSGALS